MKLFITLMIIVLTFLCVSVLNADVYIWTDENGVKHYSDHPPENVDDYEVQKGSQPNRNNVDVDSQQAEEENKDVQEFIQRADENFENQQQEEKRRAEEAEENRPPTEEEKIAAEKEKLEMKIAELEEQPLEYFGSQRNKIARIGFYRYRLEALLQDPDKYFKNPETFEGNIKESE
jgi:ATPase subunit of ABC transporter with duplicated ATPase domains